MSDYVMKISEPGHNINEGDAHLIFSSEYPMLKIHSSGNWSIEDSLGSGGDIAIPHNLGYKPMNFVFGQWWNGYDLTFLDGYEEYPFVWYAGLQAFDFFKATVNETTLNISIVINSGSAGAQTYNGFYIIFYDPNT
jgi:hypothetical protein